MTRNIGKYYTNLKLKKYRKEMKKMKEQIRFICQLNKIDYTEEFIDFVYNKHLKEFSGEILKKLKKEFE